MLRGGQANESMRDRHRRVARDWRDYRVRGDAQCAGKERLGLSGGHWDYLSHQLEERAEYAGNIWKLLAAIEHELDWGISCDTCYECAKIRVVDAIESFFDTGATSVERAIRLLRSSEPECQRCKDWEAKKHEPRPVEPRTSATVDFEYDGKRYKGTVYEVTE